MRVNLAGPCPGTQGSWVLLSPQPPCRRAAMPRPGGKNVATQDTGPVMGNLGYPAQQG